MEVGFSFALDDDVVVLSEEGPVGCLAVCPEAELGWEGEPGVGGLEEGELFVVFGELGGGFGGFRVDLCDEFVEFCIERSDIDDAHFNTQENWRYGRSVDMAIFDCKKICVIRATNCRGHRRD